MCVCVCVCGVSERGEIWCVVVLVRVERVNHKKKRGMDVWVGGGRADSKRGEKERQINNKTCSANALVRARGGREIEIEIATVAS